MRCIMINGWSLVHSILNKTFDEDYPMFTPEDEEKLVGNGSTASDSPYNQNFLADNDDNAAHHFAGPADEDLFASMDGVDLGNVDLTNDYVNYEELNLNIHANSPYNDGWTRQAAQDELDKKMAEEPSIKDPSNRKYKEDESIKALQDYISTTYGGHYTSEQNNVQTLDLIESVGDAEAFCRSNACLLYTSPSPRDVEESRMPSSA